MDENGGRKSFSSEVRRELCGRPPESRHCALAELAAMHHTHTENGLAVRHYKKLLQYAFNGGETDEQIKKATAYPMAVTHACCKKSYLRGSFISAGTLNDPAKPYHMEYTLPFPALARQLREVLRFFKLKPKITRRKTHTAVYMKESESIALALAIMGAHKYMLQFETTRVLKDMRNDVNRRVNFETANLTKTVNAAVSQIDDIRFIDQTVGLGFLSKPLEDTARLRLAYETASLQEIGAMLEPPVGKSGVNHRLRKISETARILQH
jgi:hypothetical protein